jgi:hypothetical protein
VLYPRKRSLAVAVCSVEARHREGGGNRLRRSRRVCLQNYMASYSGNRNLSSHSSGIFTSCNFIFREALTNNCFIVSTGTNQVPYNLWGFHSPSVYAACISHHSPLKAVPGRRPATQKCTWAPRWTDLFYVNFQRSVVICVPLQASVDVNAVCEST